MWNSDVNARSSYWLRVFNNSKVNGAPYAGENLPARSWRWPTETYLQRRLRWLRTAAGEEMMAALDSRRQERGTARAAHPVTSSAAQTIH